MPAGRLAILLAELYATPVSLWAFASRQSLPRGVGQGMAGEPEAQGRFMQQVSSDLRRAPPAFGGSRGILSLSPCCPQSPEANRPGRWRYAGPLGHENTCCVVPTTSPPDKTAAGGGVSAQ